MLIIVEKQSVWSSGHSTIVYCRDSMRPAGHYFVEITQLKKNVSWWRNYVPWNTVLQHVTGDVETYPRDQAVKLIHGVMITQFELVRPVYVDVR